MNILIAEDEEQMAKILKLYIKKEGFEVTVTSNGEEALDVIFDKKFDLAILDWMMPKMSGVEVCKEIKKNFNLKIIMLTAKDTTEDEIFALEVGADDYIKKPFDPRVLMIRIKKLLGILQKIVFDDFVLDTDSKKLFKNNEEIELTKREFDLLLCFYNNRGINLSRDKIIDLVWGIEYEGEYRTVDTHIYRLREKIGKNFIKTKRGLGYCFDF
ncbi:MAG: response regulator transcription factor [Sarcina sp.]